MWRLAACGQALGRIDALIEAGVKKTITISQLEGQDLAAEHELCRKLGDDGVIGGVSRRVSSLPEPLKESDTP